MLCSARVWPTDRRRGGDAGMAGGSLLVAIGEQGLNSLAVAVSFGDEGTDVGGLFTGELGAAGGAGGSAKLGTKAGAAALGTKALAEACVVLSLSARALLPSPGVSLSKRGAHAAAERCARARRRLGPQGGVQRIKAPLAAAGGRAHLLCRSYWRSGAHPPLAYFRPPLALTTFETARPC